MRSTVLYSSLSYNIQWCCSNIPITVYGAVNHNVLSAMNSLSRLKKACNQCPTTLLCNSTGVELPAAEKEMGNLFFVLLCCTQDAWATERLY